MFEEVREWQDQPLAFALPGYLVIFFDALQVKSKRSARIGQGAELCCRAA